MRLFLTLPLLSLLGTALGQQVESDTSFLASAAKYQKSLYNKSIRGQSRLYNGTEYRDYLSRNDEHPYFGIDDWQYGIIYYDDEYYDSVAMFYDLSRDKVITEHLLSGGKIELIAEKISTFTLGDHAFVRLHKDPAAIISEGFYERLYNGSTKVFVRRTKTLLSQASANTIVYSFEERNRVFIHKDGAYHPVRSKKSVLRVFPDNKPQLRAMLKEKNIRFKANRERAITMMAEKYDSIKE
jgi:hypothetical protein